MNHLPSTCVNFSVCVICSLLASELEWKMSAFMFHCEIQDLTFLLDAPRAFNMCELFKTGWYIYVNLFCQSCETVDVVQAGWKARRVWPSCWWLWFGEGDGGTRQPKWRNKVESYHRGQRSSPLKSSTTNASQVLGSHRFKNVRGKFVFSLFVMSCCSPTEQFCPDCWVRRMNHVENSLAKSVVFLKCHAF